MIWRGYPKHQFARIYNDFWITCCSWHCILAAYCIYDYDDDTALLPLYTNCSGFCEISPASKPTLFARSNDYLLRICFNFRFQLWCAGCLCCCVYNEPHHIHGAFRLLTRVHSCYNLKQRIKSKQVSIANEEQHCTIASALSYNVVDSTKTWPMRTTAWSLLIPLHNWTEESLGAVRRDT
jgi:hypothetical protein